MSVLHKQIHSQSNIAYCIMGVHWHSLKRMDTQGRENNTATQSFCPRSNGASQRVAHVTLDRKWCQQVTVGCNIHWACTYKSVYFLCGSLLESPMQIWFWHCFLVKRTGLDHILYMQLKVHVCWSKKTLWFLWLPQHFVKTTTFLLWEQSVQSIHLILYLDKMSAFWTPNYHLIFQIVENQYTDQ